MPELKKILRSRDVIGLAAGTAIGAGIFRVSQIISATLPFPGLILLCWLAGGVIALMGALVYGELSRRFPDVGGDYTYIKTGIRGPAAFLFGWTKVFIMQPAAIAAISLIFAGYFLALFPASGINNQITAICAILFLTLINILGVQKGIFFQNLTTLLKVLSVCFIAVTAFLFRPEDFSNFSPLIAPSFNLPVFQAFGMALLFVLWTYGGWNEGVFLAGEMTHPKKELPKGLFLGALLITIVYLLANTAYHFHLPVAVIAGSESPAALLVQNLFGLEASRWVALLIAVSCLGALNSLLLTEGRVSYAMARDHHWFAWLSRVNPKFLTPANGLLLGAILSVLMVLTGTFEMLVLLESIVVWLFFLLVVIVLIKIFISEKKEGKKISVLKWIPAVIWGAAGLCLVINAGISAPKEALIGILIALMGLPVYYLEKHFKKTMKSE